MRRLGHTGTLDPFATGLLLALVGPFTRLAELYHVLPKSYDATMRLGRETDTDDLTGATVSEDDGWKQLPAGEVEAAFAAREGAGLQLPSTYSARRVGGERAYAVARRGGRPALEPREIRVDAITITEYALPRVRFRARVSTGTYVRALARDIGRELGPGAHLTRLRRTAIGPFEVVEATDPPDAHRAVVAASSAWRTGPSALPWLRSRKLSAPEREEIRQGRPVSGEGVRPAAWAGLASPASEAQPIALHASGRLLAIAEAREGWLFPRKVFA